MQLRKILEGEFLWIREINQAFEDGQLRAAQGGSCAGCVVPDGAYPRMCKPVLHRACTGNAERQWAVAGG